jgi:hypothetical protein
MMENIAAHVAIVILILLENLAVLYLAWLFWGVERRDK